MADNLLIADQRFDVVRSILSIRARVLDLVKSPDHGDYAGAEIGSTDLILSDIGVPDTGVPDNVKLIVED
jgi:hypothetical protein